MIKIERLSALAEILSSIAVVATLIYLIVETKQNTDALISSSRQGSLDAELAVLFQFLERPYLYIGPVPTLPDSEWGPTELIEITLLDLAFFRTRETSWLQYRDGAMDPSLWGTYRDVLVNRIRSTNHLRQIWDLYSESFDASFREEIDSRLE